MEWTEKRIEDNSWQMCGTISGLSGNVHKTSAEEIFLFGRGTQEKNNNHSIFNGEC